MESAPAHHWYLQRGGYLAHAKSHLQSVEAKMYELCLKNQRNQRDEILKLACRCRLISLTWTRKIINLIQIKDQSIKEAKWPKFGSPNHWYQRDERWWQKSWVARINSNQSTRYQWDPNHLFSWRKGSD